MTEFNQPIRKSTMFYALFAVATGVVNLALVVAAADNNSDLLSFGLFHFPAANIALAGSGVFFSLAKTPLDRPWSRIRRFCVSLLLPTLAACGDYLCLTIIAGRNC